MSLNRVLTTYYRDLELQLTCSFPASPLIDLQSLLSTLFLYYRILNHKSYVRECVEVRPNIRLCCLQPQTFTTVFTIYSNLSKAILVEYEGFLRTPGS
jgi:hypothetical protein